MIIKFRYGEQWEEVVAKDSLDFELIYFKLILDDVWMIRSNGTIHNAPINFCNKEMNPERKELIWDSPNIVRGWRKPYYQIIRALILIIGGQDLNNVELVAEKFGVSNKRIKLWGSEDRSNITYPEFLALMYFAGFDPLCEHE